VKTILLPVDQSEQMLSALETSRLMANLYGGTVEGIALRPAFASFVTPDGIFAFDSDPGWNEEEFCHSVRQIFDTFAAGHSAELAHGARFRWRGRSAIVDEALGSLARVYDVTVLSRPGNRNVGMNVLEAALFESGRPVLMAPPTPPESLGQNILIHWNSSAETARAIELAMPILRQAKRVAMIAVEGHIFPGPSAKDALRHLADNGISATEKTATGFRNRQGEAILAEAAKIGADLLIKGAYAQSRLRQMIFGGATRHILDAAELPVFLAH
jgi:nucleotide-binding universal stress UspA family protein